MPASYKKRKWELCPSFFKITFWKALSHSMWFLLRAGFSITLLYQKFFLLNITKLKLFHNNNHMFKKTVDFAHQTQTQRCTLCFCIKSQRVWQILWLDKVRLECGSFCHVFVVIMVSSSEGCHAVPAQCQTHGHHPHITISLWIITQNISSVRPSLIVLIAWDVNNTTVNCPSMAVCKPEKNSKCQKKNC